MVAVFAFIDTESFWDMVVVFGDTGSHFGFLFGGIANFMLVTHPATLRFINFVKICIFCHILPLYHRLMFLSILVFYIHELNLCYN